MELKVVKKYKNTEVGKIPMEWEVHRLKELLEVLTDFDANGSFASVANNVKVFDYEKYAWYVRSTDLEKNSKLNKVKYVDKSSYLFLKKTALYGNELLFLKRGDIGKIYFFIMKTKFATVAPNLYLLKINKQTSSLYLYYYFNSIIGQKLLKSKNASSTLGAIYKDDVKALPVPLPPTLTEQKAIATALTDIDNLINNLEQQIQKKKAIKKGAMQQLLTPPHKGGKRLPGFEGEWTYKFLGDIGDVKMCKRIFSYETSDSGEIPFYKISTFGKIPDSYISRIKFSSFKKKYSYPKIGNVLISASGTIGRKVIYKGEECYYQDSNIVWIENNNEVVLDSFLFHLLDVVEYETEGGTIRRLYNSIIKKTDFYCPILSEQKHIAKALSDMDSEVQFLNLKKQKYQAIKQGMMQELLTGKTRLV